MSMLERFVNKFKNEGVDHIRISPFADTKLGKITSKDWRHRFFVPHMGEFTSPVCFANWICTGDDDARHNVQFRFNETVKGYLQFVLYGKFYQMCAMKGILKREMQDLPFVAYKQHASGIKEFDRWKEYPIEIKAMIDHILDDDRGPKMAYPWDENHPGLEQRIQEQIKKMVGDVEVIDKKKKKEVPVTEETEAVTEEVTQDTPSEVGEVEASQA